MRKLILLAPVLLVVLASGCTIPGLDFLFPGGGANYDGSIDLIVINSLSAVPSSVSKGQTLTLYADVQNLEKLGKGDKKVTIHLYDYCSNLFTLNDPTASNPRIEEVGPQEINTVKWTLTAKDTINLKTMCTMKVRAEYPAETNVITNVALMSESERDRRLRTGESLTISAQSPTIGAGPIKPFIQVEDPQPVVYYDANTPIRLSVQLKNVGSGFVAGDGKINPDALTIDDTEGLDLTECDGIFAKPIELVKKESPKKICEIKPNKEVGIQETRTIRGSVGYTYEFRKEVNVIVNPT